MLSYNEWEKLNENFDFTLGLTSPQSIGTVGGLGVDLEGNDLDEGKKKCSKSKKKMDVGDEEGGDGDELVKPAAPKDKDVDVDVDDDSDDSDSGGDDSVDDSEGDDVSSDDSGDDSDSGGDDSGDDMGGDKKPPFMSKKGSKKKSTKKSSKKMKKESQDELGFNSGDDEFFMSLRTQMGGDQWQMDKNWDGMPTIEEESLIAPETPAAETETSEPGPGEPGFAPTTRIGAVPTFEEWKTLNFGSDES